MSVAFLPMKSDIDKIINSRVSGAFSDILPETTNKHIILKSAEDLVRAVWVGKIYSKLPKDRTTIPEYFLDVELEQFLSEAIEECHAKIILLSERGKKDFS